MGDRELYAAPPSLPKQLTPGLPGSLCTSDGCRRMATKHSEYTVCYWHDVTVPFDEKRAALQLGGPAAGR